MLCGLVSALPSPWEGSSTALTASREPFAIELGTRAMKRTASNVIFDNGTPNVTGGVTCGAYLIVSMERSGTTTFCDDINGLDEASANHVRPRAARVAHAALLTHSII